MYIHMRVHARIILYQHITTLTAGRPKQSPPPIQRSFSVPTLQFGPSCTFRFSTFDDFFFTPSTFNTMTCFLPAPGFN